MKDPCPKDVENFIRELQRVDRRKLTVGIVIFVVALPALAVEILHAVNTRLQWFTVIVVAGSLLHILWSLYELRRANRALLAPASGKLRRASAVHVEDTEIRIGEIEPAADDHAAGFRRVQVAGESLHVSDEVDASLREGQSLFLVGDDRKHERVRKRILANAKVLVPLLLLRKKEALASGGSSCNERKLCLARGLRADRQSIYYHCGSYYESFLTNEVSSQVLSENGQTTRFDFLYPIDIDPITRLPFLKQIDRSDVNDHIGISSVALTKDKLLVLWQQAPSAQQSVGLTVPTGSGSCDDTDLRSDLSSTLVYAMQREILEETTLKRLGRSPSEVGETRLLGFFRWVQRAGKPEFIGMTRLAYRGDELWPEEKELDAKVQIRLPCPSPEELVKTLDAIVGFERLSVPLAHIALSLRRMLSNSAQRAYVVDFWFGSGR